jgi:helicase
MALLATFVGVGRYSDPAIRDLVGATRDAKALHALFADTVPSANPKLLIDFEATTSAIRQALIDTLGAASEDDTVIFSFSGHGSHDHRLAASDTTLADLQNTSIPMDELAALFKSSRARAILCILDCCFSGGAPAKVLEDSPIPRDPADPFGVLIGEGRVLLAASAVDEVA